MIGFMIGHNIFIFLNMGVRFWISDLVMAPVRGVSVIYVRRKRRPLIIRLGMLLRGEKCRNISMGNADKSDVK